MQKQIYKKIFERINVCHIHASMASASLEELLQFLVNTLTRTNAKDVIFILAQAGRRLYKLIDEKDMKSADNQLLMDYCRPAFQEQIKKLKKQNADYILFTPMAFRLIHHLLIHQVDFDGELDESNLLFSEFKNVNEFLFSLAFLIANRILDYVDDSLKKLELAVRDIKMFYLSYLTDPTSAISRANMYDDNYFSEKLKSIYGVSARELVDSILDFYAHVVSQDPAIIDEERTFKNFLNNEKKEVAQTVLDLLSQKQSSVSVSLNDLIKNLCDDLCLDRSGRGKPFIQVGELYYCVRPDLLDKALGDLPYHLIFTHLLKNKEKSENERNDLKSKRGLAYENYLFDITQELLGKEICISESYKKSGEFGDMIIKILPNKLLISEIKLAEPQEALLLGNVEELKKRFLIPQKRHRDHNDTPGPLQLMHRASEYREKTGYEGVIQPIMISYGWFPELVFFDELYEQLIKGHEICVKYDANPSNLPLILMNGFTWELILSAVQQKSEAGEDKLTTLNSIMDLLKLDANFPSRTSTKVDDYISSQQLHFSVYPLFKKKITERAEASRQRLSK